MIQSTTFIIDRQTGRLSTRMSTRYSVADNVDGGKEKAINVGLPALTFS